MPSLEQLEKLLAVEPDDVFLNFALAMELSKQGRTDEACRQFRRVLDLDPRYPAAYFQWGKALIAAHRHAEARDVLAKGIETAQSAGDRHAAAEMQELLEAIPG